MSEKKPLYQVLFEELCLCLSEEGVRRLPPKPDFSNRLIAMLDASSFTRVEVAWLYQEFVGLVPCCCDREGPGMIDFIMERFVTELKTHKNVGADGSVYNEKTKALICDIKRDFDVASGITREHRTSDAVAETEKRMAENRLYSSLHSLRQEAARIYREECPCKVTDLFAAEIKALNALYNETNLRMLAYRQTFFAKTLEELRDLAEEASKSPEVIELMLGPVF